MLAPARSTNEAAICVTAKSAAVDPCWRWCERCRSRDQIRAMSPPTAGAEQTRNQLQSAWCGRCSGNSPTTSDVPLTGAWMFGDALLVSPIVELGQATHRFYLPRGAWLDYSTGKPVRGGTDVSVPPMARRGRKFRSMCAKDRYWPHSLPRRVTT